MKHIGDILSLMFAGKFKNENFLSQFKPITPEEIMELLKSASYDKVVKGQGTGDISSHVISDADLNRLLDRSDMWHKTAAESERSVDCKIFLFGHVLK